MYRRMNPQDATAPLDPSARAPLGGGVLLSFNQVLAMLAARRRLIALTVLATILTTLVLVLLLPRTWVSSTDIYIDYKENDPISGRTFSALLDDSYMQTQIDMLKSQRVAEQALAKLDWSQGARYADAVKRYGKAQADADLADVIIRNTTVSSARGSRVLTVSYSADSPTVARDVANALVQSYIEVNQNIAVSAARSRSEQYGVQIDQLRKEADDIQQELTRYQQQAGVLDSAGDDLDMRRLQGLNLALVELQGKRQNAQSIGDSARALLGKGTDVSQLPEIAQLPTIQDLKSKLNDNQRRLGEVSGSLGPNHPTMRGLVAERSQLQARLQREAAAALAGLGADGGRLAEDEESLRKEIDGLQDVVLKKKEHLDRIAAYKRQLASVEQVYNAALQSYDELLIASNITQTDISVLRPAEVPFAPTLPKVKRSLAASVGIGLILGLCLAFILELVTRRVRCVDDVVRSDDGLPLLGRIGRQHGIGDSAPFGGREAAAAS